MATFGERLRDLRIKKNLTQEELGKMLGKSKNNISQYERNIRQTDDEIKMELASFFNVTIDYLLGRTDDPTTYKLEKENLPSKLKKEGIEYLEVNNYIKKYGLSKKEIKEILELALEINNKGKTSD